jgi:hypothetical protein
VAGFRASARPDPIRDRDFQHRRRVGHPTGFEPVLILNLDRTLTEEGVTLPVENQLRPAALHLVSATATPERPASSVTSPTTVVSAQLSCACW